MLRGVGNIAHAAVVTSTASRGSIDEERGSCPNRTSMLNSTTVGARNALADPRRRSFMMCSNSMESPGKSWSPSECETECRWRF